MIPLCSGQNHGSRQLGVPCRLSKHVTHMQCPEMSVLPCMLMVPNGQMVIICVVWTYPWTSSRVNSVGAVRSGVVEGQALHSIPIPLALLQGSWSDLDITAPKKACFQVTVALTISPFVIIPITLSIILDLTMTGTFLE